MYDCGFRRVGAYPGPGVQARLQCSIDMEEPAWRREAEGAGRGWGMWPTAQDRTGVLGEAVEALLAPALSTPSLSLSRPVSLSCCDYIQGWYYAKAIPLEECEDFIKKHALRFF